MAYGSSGGRAEFGRAAGAVEGRSSWRGVITRAETSLYLEETLFGVDASTAARRAGTHSAWPPGIRRLAKGRGLAGAPAATSSRVRFRCCSCLMYCLLSRVWSWGLTPLRFCSSRMPFVGLSSAATASLRLACEFERTIGHAIAARRVPASRGTDDVSTTGGVQLGLTLSAVHRSRTKPFD